jgi:hypothetical protein
MAVVDRIELVATGSKRPEAAIRASLEFDVVVTTFSWQDRPNIISYRLSEDRMTHGDSL